MALLNGHMICVALLTWTRDLWVALLTWTRDLRVALLTWTQVVELTFLRAICRHALGELAEAVADYDKCLAYSGGRGVGPELGLCVEGHKSV